MNNKNNNNLPTEVVERITGQVAIEWFLGDEKRKSFSTAQVFAVHQTLNAAADDPDFATWYLGKCVESGRLVPATNAYECTACHNVMAAWRCNQCAMPFSGVYRITEPEGGK